jgi:hypothetical protein
LQLLLTQQKQELGQAPPRLLVLLLLLLLLVLVLVRPLLLVLVQVPAPQLQGSRKASCVRHTNA